MIKTLLTTLVLLVLGAVPLRGQINVPYEFVPNTPASATQVNANFDMLLDALDRTGGELTGNITALPGVTVDGVDISKVFGDGNNTITTERANFVSTTVPQLVVGYDLAHLWETHVDINGNANFLLTAAGSRFYFNKPVNINGGLTIQDTPGSLICSGCLTDGNLQDVNASPGTWGSVSAVPVFNVNADGRITSVSNVPISIPETAISGTDVFARTGATETITGAWTFTTMPIFPGGFDPGQIPETSIIDGALLARVAAAEIISAMWTFNAGIRLNFPSDIRLYGAGEGGVIRQASNCPGFPGLWLGSREGGQDHLVLCLSDDLVTAYGHIKPSEDGRWALGDPDQRFTTAYFALPPVVGGKPNLVIVNKGGTGADKNTSIAYFTGYPGLLGDEAVEVTKTMGACQVTIRAGLILNVTGC